MRALVDRFRYAIVAGFRQRTIVALLRIVLAFVVSVKQRRGPKMPTSSRSTITDHHAYRKYTECL